MSNKILLQNEFAANLKFNQITRSEVKQEQVKTNSSNVPDIVVSLAPVGLLVSWIIFFLVLQKTRRVLDNKMVPTVKTLYKVPCKNCQFYANNNYLKCAVNPSVVLTEEAKNCPEYSPKKGEFPPKNLFK
ncbi:hypothetical protein I8752_07040 [Nostocaceae cyanobacterium CENA369]|uniref:Uncharacterized protein n=1 Tax=Dendronalium phyllosphericum CENA369 TaxID=1725256 RepID=A0A8J7LE87_9NOST|nr:hypothetical protein [Dendronalium phyllosphericum]MBH8572773.1 hypothetical protein [Dendronalium phyllosphericum CENA369]